MQKINIDDIKYMISECVDSYFRVIKRNGILAEANFKIENTYGNSKAANIKQYICNLPYQYVDFLNENSILSKFIEYLYENGFDGSKIVRPEIPDEDTGKIKLWNKISNIKLQPKNWGRMAKLKPIEIAWIAYALGEMPEDTYKFARTWTEALNGEAKNFKRTDELYGLNDDGTYKSAEEHYNDFLKSLHRLDNKGRTQFAKIDTKYSGDVHLIYKSVQIAIHCIVYVINIFKGDVDKARKAIRGMVKKANEAAGFTQKSRATTNRNRQNSNAMGGPSSPTDSVSNNEFEFTGNYENESREFKLVPIETEATNLSSVYVITCDMFIKENGQWMQFDAGDKDVPATVTVRKGRPLTVYKVEGLNYENRYFNFEIAPSNPDEWNDFVQSSLNNSEGL